MATVLDKKDFIELKFMDGIFGNEIAE